MTSFLLLILLITLLIYTVYKQNVGSFACFSLFFFCIAVSLFYVASSVLFSLNAVFHTALLVILLIWQFNYYSWHNVYEYMKNPVILSVLAISVIMVLYNDISPYYHTYKDVINNAQLGFYFHALFPFLLLPMIVPDRYSRHEMILAMPFWGLIYAIVIISTLNLSSKILSDRMLLSESIGGITGGIFISRIFAIVTIVAFMKIISLEYKKPVEKITYIVACIFFYFAVLIAGQRGTLIGLGIALLSLFLRKEFRHHFLIISSIAIVIVLFFVTFIDFGQFEIFQRFSQFEDIRSFERYYDYGRTWEIFSSNNYLWGLGSKGYYFRTGRPWPHNIILEHISDYGLVGFACIFFLLFFCIKYAITLIRYSNYYIDLTIACGWIVLCFSAMVSSSMLDYSLFYIFTGLLVLTYQDFRHQFTNSFTEFEQNT